MCRKFIYSVSFILLLAVSTKVQAVMFSDEFEAPHDYITNGVEGTGWDGFLGLSPGETVDALNASIDRAGQLYMESTGAFYHEPWDPLGPFLYKIIEGDFIATVKVSDYAGTPGAEVYHNNCGLLARANPDDAGPGEDWVAIDYFPIWSCGNFVRTADNGVRTENGHNGAQWDLDPYLQLERKGNTFHFRTSADGVTWIEMDASPIIRDDLDGLPLQVGLYQATYSGDPGYAAYDDFRVGPRMKAWNPNPADGALNTALHATMGWSPGGFAVSHDVYVDDNFEDVNAGTGDAFRGNQDLPYYVIGFPTYPFPEGLVPGTTYYWRIDEVNDLHPDSPWRGNVWSFSIPSKKAYYPVPSDGSKFIDAENLTLTWTPGFEAVLHTVYFGDDYDTVSNATGGLSQGGIITFRPGPLEVEKTYYWRVDEFDENQAMHTGEVWSFTTAREGGGLKGEYYHHSGGTPTPPATAFQTLVLTRTDPQINFSAASPEPGVVNEDNFAIRWTGEVDAAFTETYTFYSNADDGVMLWIDGQLIIDDWVIHPTTENRGTIDLVAGQQYSIEMWFFEAEGGAEVQLSWSSPSTQKQIIPQAAFSPPVKASGPSPANGATGTKMTPILRWGVGDFTASHEVYFGTDANAVKNATTASPEYIGPRTLGDESYDPGELAWFTEYFWRVDEVNNLNPDSPWIGNLWSFTTGDFLVIDDFEDYDIGNNEIWFSWNDGLGAGTPGNPGYVPPNGTGSMIGDDTTGSYTEETIVHGGSQSMPYWYDNNKQGFNKYSEAKLTLTAPRDWTVEGVTELSLWFRGNPASVGSFVEGPVGTYTMTGSGADIWGQSDQFHYAFKTLTGAGSIVARVESLTDTHPSAKAAVMIRETLAPDSMYWLVAVRPGSNGVIAEYRDETGQGAQQMDSLTGITAPYWVKIERDIAGNFTAYSSDNGSTWQMLGQPIPFQMAANAHIGLAVTAHNATATCEAKFSNVTIIGNAGPLWTNQDIGIQSNNAEPLYVALANSAGNPAVVVHDNPDAALIDTWTEWVIPLQAFEDQGIVLTNVDSIAIGLGTQGNMTIPGGAGKMYFDDIRLYRSRTAAE